MYYYPAASSIYSLAPRVVVVFPLPLATTAHHLPATGLIQYKSSNSPSSAPLISTHGSSEINSPYKLTTSLRQSCQNHGGSTFNLQPVKTSKQIDAVDGG
jgi:hypothetical protein